MSEWISVKDRLPEYEDSYFVYRPEEDPPYLVSTLEEGEWWPDVGDDVLDGVRYWCPLPPRPEPQLTVKEALAKAISYIELCGLIGTITDKLTADPLLPRLRAALESAEEVSRMMDEAQAEYPEAHIVRIPGAYRVNRVGKVTTLERIDGE